MGVATLTAPFQQSMALCIPSSEVAAAISRHQAHPEVVVIEGAVAGVAPAQAEPQPGADRDALKQPPVDDPDGSPASRLAACDAGRVLPADHPRVKEAAGQLAAARLVFRQEESAIVRFVVDVVARLRERGESVRASEVLGTMIESAPAPEGPGAKRDAAAYAVFYHKAALSSRTYAETVIAMRKAADEAERGLGAGSLARRRPQPAEDFAAPPPPLPRRIARRGPQPSPNPAASDDPGPAGAPAVAMSSVPAFVNRPGTSSPVPVAYDVASLDRLANISRDGTAYAKSQSDSFTRSSAFFRVEDWTRVEVLDTKKLGSFVRVASGPMTGKAGWVPANFVRFDSPERNPTRAGVLLRAAKDHSAGGRKQQAIEAFEQIVREFANTVEAREARAGLAALKP